MNYVIRSSIGITKGKQYLVFRSSAPILKRPFHSQKGLKNATRLSKEEADSWLTNQSDGNKGMYQVLSVDKI